MYDRKKLTIKGRFSDVCFRQKMLSGPKDRSFTPPENLPEDGLKYTFIRENWRFSAFGQNANCAEIYHKTKKPTGLTVGSNLQMVGVTELESVTSTMSTWRSNQLSYTPIVYDL